MPVESREDGSVQENLEPSTHENTPGLWVGLLFIFLFAIFVAQFDAAISAWLAPWGLFRNPFGYPLAAVALGLVLNLVLRITKIYPMVSPAIQPSLFLRIGLVLMGAHISYNEIGAGAGGLIQAAIIITAVFAFTWWLAGKLAIDAKLKTLMAAAVSVCGISAAVAVASSVQAKKEDVAYTTGLVIITSLPLMILLPFIAQAIGLPAEVAGAWFGGNIDTIAAVVGAGTLHSEAAQQIAAMVKISQISLIGVVVFALTVYFAPSPGDKRNKTTDPAIIWQRFPKFVLGFILVAVLSWLGAFQPEQLEIMKIWYKWAFAMAFLAIGLEFSWAEIKSKGWPPVFVYLTATVFNTLLALGSAYLIFG